jgi:pimeloyl-ACP methyl ester carboxylesterase
VNIYYEEHGYGEPLIMLTGPLLDSKSWFNQMELANYARIILMDNRDSGMSERSQVSYTMEVMADDVNALMRKLKLDRAHLVGFSMGGMVAQAFAILYPAKVKSLVLVSTSYGGKDSVLRLLDLLNTDEVSREVAMELLTRFFSRDWLMQNTEVFSRLVESYTKNLLTDSLRNQLSAMRIFDLSRRVNQISVPTMIVQGEIDELSPIQNSLSLHNKVHNSRLLVFKGAGHAVHIERPREFNKEVLKHIDMARKSTFRREGPLYV